MRSRCKMRSPAQPPAGPPPPLHVIASACQGSRRVMGDASKTFPWYVL